MSRNSRLGYDAEHMIQLWLAEHGYPSERPRAGAPNDRGDLVGLPVVVSVKNHRTLALAEWVDALPRMTDAAGVSHGVVWHKRRGRGSPGAWYVTMTGETFVAFLRAYGQYTPVMETFDAVSDLLRDDR